jgi:hypothetical protein
MLWYGIADPPASHALACFEVGFAILKHTKTRELQTQLNTSKAMTRNHHTKDLWSLGSYA